MVDVSSNNRSNTELDFSTKDALNAFQVARLPHLYEKSLGDVDDRKIANQVIKDNAPQGMSNYNIIQIDSTTAIIAYDPDEHKATVSFDPTYTIGDKWDNIQRSEENHNLGGQVHGGIYDDLISEQDSPNFPGDSMSEVVQGILHDYASRNPDKSLDVNFSGFSKGGAQTALMAGELISDDFFDENENMNLGEIYTFGAPGYGDDEFVQSLNKSVQDLGGDMYEIKIHGDPTPDVLTPDGGNMFTRYNYGQAGDNIYIIPEHNGKAASFLINPTNEELSAINPANPSIRVHTMDNYSDVLSKLNASEEHNVPTPDVSQNLVNDQPSFMQP